MGTLMTRLHRCFELAEGTVKSRVHKGIQLVRKELIEDDQGRQIFRKTIEQGRG